MDNNMKSLISFLVGASAGLVAGVLLAPESGERTRKKLKRTADKYKDDLEKQTQKGIETFNDLKESAEKTVEKAIQNK